MPEPITFQREIQSGGKSAQIDSGAAREQERLRNDPEMKTRISARAYELHEMRGRAPGREMDDWLRAENEILQPLMNQGAAQPNRDVARPLNKSLSTASVENAAKKEAFSAGVPPAGNTQVPAGPVKSGKLRRGKPQDPTLPRKGFNAPEQTDKSD